MNGVDHGHLSNLDQVGGLLDGCQSSYLSVEFHVVIDILFSGRFCLGTSPGIFAN